MNLVRPRARICGKQACPSLGMPQARAKPPQWTQNNRGDYAACLVLLRGHLGKSSDKLGHPVTSKYSRARVQAT